MILYVARHAEAVGVGGAIVRDAERTLTPQGESDACAMGKAMARMGAQPGLVMTSPLVRAVQTARLLTAQLGDHTALHVSDRLSPGFNLKSLLADLPTRCPGGGIMVVGHQPDMGMLVSFLLTGGQEVAVRMAPCSVVSLTIQPDQPNGTAQLNWLLSADLTRGLVSPS